MRSIKTIATPRAAGVLLALGLLLGCSSPEGAGSAAPTPEAASPEGNAAAPTALASATPEASAATAIVSQFPPDGLAGSVIIDSVNAEGTVRARTSAGPGEGELLMISSSTEERGHLNVSSNYGLEGEQTYQADYSIVYRKGQQDQVLLKLPAFLFVQPADRVLEFTVIHFEQAEVFLLAPQYKSGHGLVAYAFAMDKKSGLVFPVSFKQGEIVHDTLVYSELPPFPANEDEQLVVYAPVGAGGDPEPGPQRYELDLDKRQFVAGQSE
ncbi:hypothetical protein MHI24_13500 [Paenibacillus sp. FSL K6-1096]|uniref:hypothetical protein n=1 Tax=Paenibacillus sp. FSL K6-1096 TaxID=2921460 RepID=UPI0030EC7856